MDEDSSARTLDLIGGDLCLDLANTAGNHNTDEPHEHLPSFGALVGWSEHAGILTRRQARALLEQAARRPAEAQRALDSAIVLRESLYRIFSAVARKDRVAAGDLDTLNDYLSQALPHARIVKDGDRLAWDWERPEHALDQMLWPIARSAADLLTSERLVRVRECEGDECGWLFMDTSKNHSRRWCSMGDCGNRAKVSRFYRRRRAAAA